MLFGLPADLVLNVHVLLSLAGIATGLAVLFGMIAGRRLDRLTALFLLTTILTSVTGFFFPLTPFGPAHVIGVLSLVVLAVALVARYGYGLAGIWRVIYVVTAVTALYFNVFVGVVQAFQKLPVLHALAPTQSELPFIVAQTFVLAALVWLGVLAARRLRA